jgi:hypothetical protein
MRLVGLSADRLERLCWRSWFLRLRLGLRRIDSGRLGDELLVRLVVLGAHRAAEVPDSLPKRAPSFRQPLRSEYEQRDNEDQQQMRGLKDVVDKWHRHKLTRCLAPVTGLFADRWSYGQSRPGD